MSKIEPLTPILSTYSSTSKLNAHLDKIEAAFQNTLSRDGSAPNEMETDINMNDNQLINVAEPLLDHNVATKRYVDDLVSGEGTYIISTSALGTGWGNVLANPQTGSGPATATSYGYLATGLTATAASNRTALQAALDANYWVILPPGTGYTNGITHTRTNRLSGCGPETILFLGDSANSRMFTAVSKTDMIYEDFVINMNYANNTGSGAHDGIRLEGCTNPSIYRVKVIGAQGLFSGSPVGGGISVSTGSGIKLVEVECTECFDNLQVNAHPNGTDLNCIFTAGRRFGVIIDNGSHEWRSTNLKATGNSTTDSSGHNYGVQNSDRCSLNGGDLSGAVLGSGGLISSSDYYSGRDIRADDNGLDGFGPFGSLYCKIENLSANRNAVRGLTIDSLSHYASAVNISCFDNGDVDVSVFRSSDFKGINMEFETGRVHEATRVGSVTIAAGGAGYTNGVHLVEIAGGTIGPLGRATFNATVSGGVVTAVSAIINGGEYWDLPTNPVTVTGLPAGAGATFTVVWDGANSNTSARAMFIGGGQGATMTIAKDPNGGISSSSDVVFVNFKGNIVDEDGTAVLATVACPLAKVPVKNAVLQNSWVVDTRCVYYKDSDGIVHIEGRIKNGTVAPNTLIFTLPVGFRPAFSERWFVNANGTLGQVYIEPDGEVRDLGGSFSAGITTLNGVSFRAV